MASQNFPPRANANLLDHEDSPRHERGRGGVEHFECRSLTQEIQDIHDGDGVPLPRRPVVGFDLFELDRSLRDHRGRSRVHQLLAIDINRGDATVGRRHGQVDRHYTVSATEVEDTTFPRYRIGDCRSRTRPQPDSDVQARTSRCTREDGLHLPICRISATQRGTVPSAAKEPKVKPARSTASCASGATTAASSSPQ